MYRVSSLILNCTLSNSEFKCRIKRKVANSIIILVTDAQRGRFSSEFVQNASEYMMNWLKFSLFRASSGSRNSESTIYQAMELTCVKAFGALALLAPVGDNLLVHSDDVEFNIVSGLYLSLVHECPSFQYACKKSK